MSNTKLLGGTEYFTVRDYWGDGSKAGSFFVNGHKDGSYLITQSDNYSYHHKRTARVAAKKLAARLGVPYRQDLEYTEENFPKDITIGMPIEAKV